MYVHDSEDREGRGGSCTTAGSFGDGAADREGYGTNIGNNQRAIGRLVRNVRRQERADLRNRFLSIHMDAQFVSGLVNTYRRHGCEYPVFANLRNGLWYGKEWDGACCFKSTDGHSRRWAFSYTRLNVHLAKAAAAGGGCILVDSTRTGKRYPDSFTATVPIWCCVLNRLAAYESEGGGDASGADKYRMIESNLEGLSSHPRAWDTDLHTPRWLSASEASQIEERVPGWLDGLGKARAPLSKRLRGFLKKPLRPVWLSPETRLVEGMLPGHPSSELSFTPVICVSASKIITPERHREHHSWTYLQGAGDDEEHWSAGLTPEKFWENSERLIHLATSGGTGEFEGVIEALLAGSATQQSHAGDGRWDGASVKVVSQDLSRPTGAVSRRGFKGVEGGGVEWTGDWFSGGQELHAVLGATGLAVGSLAFAAHKWPLQEDDWSLLNLSDTPFPDSIVRSCTCSGRRYLHIPLKAGKKANPPRYWKTTVFPAALAYIAETIGGMTPRGHDSSFPVSAGDLASGTRGGTAAAEPTGMSEAFDDDVIGATAGEEKGRQDIPAEQGIPVPGISWIDEGGSSSSLTETARCVDVSPANPCKVGAAAPSTERRQGRRRVRSLRETTSLAAATGSKCLVVCPTGAEASVIVCLAALVAFFPPPQAQATTDDRLSTLAGETDKPVALAATGVRASPTAASVARSVAACGLGTEHETDAAAQDRIRGGAKDCTAVGSKDPPSAERSSTTARESFEPPSTTEVPIKSARGSQPVVGNGSAHTSNIQDHGGRPASLAASPCSGAAATRTAPSVTVDEEEQAFTFAGGTFSVSARGKPADDYVTKSEVRWWFLLLQQEYPWARPPRRLMQELNEYFMTPGEHSWWSLRDRLVDPIRDRGTC